MARSALPENAILLGLEKKGGQLPAAKLPKSSDREKLLELLASKSFVRVDDGVVVLTATGAERVRQIREEAAQANNAKARKKGAAAEAKLRKAEATTQKKEAAAEAKRLKAEAAQRKKEEAGAEKRRAAAIRASIAALNALLREAKMIAAKTAKGVERVRRAQAVHDSLESELIPRFRDLVTLLGGAPSAPDAPIKDLRAAVEGALRGYVARGRRGFVRLPELRQELGVSREDLHATLRAMRREAEPVISLDIAADPSAVEDPSEGIRTEGGLLYYVALRR